VYQKIWLPGYTMYGMCI
jgi:hypothetical protein